MPDSRIAANNCLTKWRLFLCQFCHNALAKSTNCQRNGGLRGATIPIVRLSICTGAARDLLPRGGADHNGENHDQSLVNRLAAAALTVAGAFAAQAADLPTRKEAPAPVFVPPPFTWTGFYVGVNAGGIWGTGNTTINAFFPATPFGGVVLSNLSRRFVWTPAASGFIGGGQAGYNWQTGMFVLGAETDFDWTSMSKSSFHRRPRLQFPSTAFPTAE